MGYNELKIRDKKLDLDTLKTGAIGLSGGVVSASSWLPEAISVGVGIATLIYLIIKIVKELR